MKGKRYKIKCFNQRGVTVYNGHFVFVGDYVKIDIDKYLGNEEKYRNEESKKHFIDMMENCRDVEMGIEWIAEYPSTLITLSECPVLMDLKYLIFS
jgi:hypothetical protein